MIRMLGLLLLLFPVLESCNSNSCPEDEFVGLFEFSSITKSLTNYDGVTGLTFVDESDVEYSFVTKDKLVDSTFINCIHQPCAFEFGENQCLNGEFERREISFESGEIEIDISVIWSSVGSISNLDTNYGEFISTRISSPNFSTVSGFFASNWMNVDSTHIKYQNNYPLRLPSLQLINKEYNNVFAQHNSIWYTPEYGLIGFNIDGANYELEEVIR